MVSPDIAMIILITLIVLFSSGLLLWLTYITIKNKSHYENSKENRRFVVFSLIMMGGILLIDDYTPADSSDLEKIEQYLEAAKQENNQDLLFTIEKIKMQPEIAIKDRKYIEKLIEKGI